MRTQDYIKQAATTVREAAVACKQECDEIRKSLGLMDQRRHERFNSLKNQERERLATAGTSDSDEERSRNEIRARMLRDEETRLEHDFEHKKKLLDDELQTKQRLIDDLNALARQLDNYGVQAVYSRPRV